MYVLFGVPCPSCGMTTSWAHVMHGDLSAALGANVGGTLLAGLAAAATPWLLISAAANRWWAAAPRDRWLALLAGMVVAVTMVDWLWRLSRGWQ